MSIPDFQSFMLPVLKCLSNGENTGKSAIYNYVADYLQLSEDDKNEILPSGRDYTYQNRISWALAYFKKAKVVETPERGIYRITERGRELLGESPSRIDNNTLMRYSEFVEFRQSGRNKIPGDNGTDNGDDDKKTPLEQIEEGFLKVKSELADDLLDSVKKASPRFFEKVVLELLLAMGYGGSRKEAGQVTQYSNDGGIDGIINEDKLGLDVIYIQAKRWDNPVSRPEIQKFVGALAGKRARKGVFITSSSFTKDASEYVKNINDKIILIDGQRLAQLMIEHNIGTTTTQSYHIKRVDTDYFIED